VNSHRNARKGLRLWWFAGALLFVSNLIVAGTIVAAQNLHGSGYTCAVAEYDNGDGTRPLVLDLARGTEITFDGYIETRQTASFAENSPDNHYRAFVEESKPNWPRAVLIIQSLVDDHVTRLPIDEGSSASGVPVYLYWSPDSHWAFYTGGNGGFLNLISADGTEHTTSDAGFPHFGWSADSQYLGWLTVPELHPVAALQMPAPWFASWSPQGHQFAGIRDDLAGTILAITSSELSQVATYTFPSPIVGYDPNRTLRPPAGIVWSPDSAYVAATDASGDGHELRVFKTDGTGSFDLGAVWSPAEASRSLLTYWANISLNFYKDSFATDIRLPAAYWAADSRSVSYFMGSPDNIELKRFFPATQQSEPLADHVLHAWGAPKGSQIVISWQNGDHLTASLLSPQSEALITLVPNAEIVYGSVWLSDEQALVTMWKADSRLHLTWARSDGTQMQEPDSRPLQALYHWYMFGNNFVYVARASNEANAAIESLDLRTGTIQRVGADQWAAPAYEIYSPDLKHVASLSSLGSATYLGLASGGDMRLLAANYSGAYTLESWSPDSALFAVFADDNSPLPNTLLVYQADGTLRWQQELLNYASPIVNFTRCDGQPVYTDVFTVD